MASSKHYAYYIRGSQLAIIEHDSSSGDGLNYVTAGDDVNDINDIGPSGSSLWKSPTEAIADGIEIEYAYSPRYRITDTSKVDTNITAYRSSGGYLEIGDATSAYTNYGNLSGYNIADGSYIVLRNAGRWNGLHKTITKTNLNGTNDTIKLETRYNGSSSWSNFEEAVNLYYNVDALNDEADTIDLPEYLSKALVYYVKARLAEDQMQIEEKEYLMREFRRILEKHESSKVWGARQLGVGPHGIR
jgi:hypothetical protein